jgi:hypothetical protein
MRRENRQWHALYTAERKANTPTLYLNDDIPAREGMAEIEPLELVKAWNYLRELLAHVPDGLSRVEHWRYLRDGLLAKFAPPVAVRTLAFMIAIRDHYRKPQALGDDKIIVYARAASAPLDPHTLTFLDVASIFEDLRVAES